MSSYDIVNAFSDLATTTERIDTGQLAKSLTTLATEFKDSPQDVQGRARRAEPPVPHHRLARRRAQARCSPRPTASPAPSPQRNKAVESIIKNADLLLVELDKRREDIHTLFVNTSTMAQQITGLVRDNRAELKPALDQLTKVLAVLQKHEQDLGDTIAAMAPFTRLFANVLGNGRWFDTYIQNLTTPVAAGRQVMAPPPCAALARCATARAASPASSPPSSWWRWWPAPTRSGRATRPSGSPASSAGAVGPLPGLRRAHPRRAGRPGQRR